MCIIQNNQYRGQVDASREHLDGGHFASSNDAQQPEALPVRDDKIKVIISSQLPALPACLNRKNT